MAKMANNTTNNQALDNVPEMANNTHGAAPAQQVTPQEAAQEPAKAPGAISTWVKTHKTGLAFGAGIGVGIAVGVGGKIAYDHYVSSRDEEGYIE